ALASTAAPTDSALGSAASAFAIADFDGDSKPDIAKVLASGTEAGQSRYSIDFELTTGLKQRIVISAPSGGLSLASRDINGDNFPDLVVTTAWTRSPVAVLINDGHGGFTRIDPSNFPGAFRTAENSLGFPQDDQAHGTALVSPRPSPG